MDCCRLDSVDSVHQRRAINHFPRTQDLAVGLAATATVNLCNHINQNYARVTPAVQYVNPIKYARISDADINSFKREGSTDPRKTGSEVSNMFAAGPAPLMQQFTNIWQRGAEDVYNVRAEWDTMTP